jgi:hypothetical protein
MGRSEAFIGSFIGAKRFQGAGQAALTGCASAIRWRALFTRDSEDLNMADTLDPKHLDKRTAERYLRSGQLDEKTYERHLKSLPDVAEKAAVVETAMDGDDFDDEDEDMEDDEEGEDEGSEDSEAP